ncbi:hypothetical protein H2136_16145, partial [Aeromonas hydrophila]|nr:hypothetical protein [Aeromonas hydrophila]
MRTIIRRTRRWPALKRAGGWYFGRCRRTFWCAPLRRLLPIWADRRRCGEHILCKVYCLPIPNRLLDNDPVMIVISVLALAFYLLAIIASLHLLLS